MGQAMSVVAKDMAGASLATTDSQKLPRHPSMLNTLQTTELFPKGDNNPFPLSHPHSGIAALSRERPMETTGGRF